MDLAEMDAEKKEEIEEDVSDSLICQLLEAKERIEDLHFEVDFLQENNRKAFYDIDNKISDLKEKYTQITKNKYAFIEIEDVVADLDRDLSDNLQDFMGIINDVENILFEMSKILDFEL